MGISCLLFCERGLWFHSTETWEWKEELYRAISYPGNYSVFTLPEMSGILMCSSVHICSLYFKEENSVGFFFSV